MYCTVLLSFLAFQHVAIFEFCCCRFHVESLSPLRLRLLPLPSLPPHRCKMRRRCRCTAPSAAFQTGPTYLFSAMDATWAGTCLAWILHWRTCPKVSFVLFYCFWTHIDSVSVPFFLLRTLPVIFVPVHPRLRLRCLARSVNVSVAVNEDTLVCHQRAGFARAAFLNKGKPGRLLLLHRCAPLTRRSTAGTSGDFDLDRKRSLYFFLFVYFFTSGWDWTLECMTFVPGGLVWGPRVGVRRSRRPWFRGRLSAWSLPLFLWG